MWEEILRLAVEGGLWAVLFCALLIYQLRDSRTREQKYRQTIDALCDRLRTVSAVHEDTQALLKRLDEQPSATENTHELLQEFD